MCSTSSSPAMGSGCTWDRSTPSGRSIPNVTAHHNPLSTDDFERLRVNVRDCEKHLALIQGSTLTLALGDRQSTAELAEMKEGRGIVWQTRHQMFWGCL